MDLNWLQSILYGFLSGVTEILPVSAQAHKALMLKIYGTGDIMELMNLLVHLGVFAGLYFCNQSQLTRFSRARALARVPKRKRKRPLDVRTLMDLSMLKTMLIPAVVGLVLYRYTADMQGNLLLIAIFLFLNGLILYIPQFFPTSNRDSRTLSRVEGILMGVGGAISMLPGLSAVGAATSIGSICGVERTYCLNMALLLNMFLMAGFVIYDVMALMAYGAGALSFSIFLRYLVTALAAFAGCVLGIRFLRKLAENHSFSIFGLYCVGLSLFTFILNLMA